MPRCIVFQATRLSAGALWMASVAVGATIRMDGPTRWGWGAPRQSSHYQVPSFILPTSGHHSRPRAVSAFHASRKPDSTTDQGQAPMLGQVEAGESSQALGPF